MHGFRCLAHSPRKSWALASLFLQRSCWTVIKHLEQRQWHARLHLVLFTRADLHVAPGASLAQLVGPISAMLRSRAPAANVSREARPLPPHIPPPPPSPRTGGIVFTPDTEAYGGANDRLAIMNRAGAAAYLTRFDTLFVAPPTATLAALARRFRKGHNTGHLHGNAESLLSAALAHANVSVGTFPTLSYLTCCQVASGCFTRASCHAYCLAGRGTAVRYGFEAEYAAMHAALLRTSLARLAPCAAGLCMLPPPPQPWDVPPRARAAMFIELTPQPPPAPPPVGAGVSSAVQQAKKAVRTGAEAPPIRCGDNMSARGSGVVTGSDEALRAWWQQRGGAVRRGSVERSEVEDAQLSEWMRR